MKTVAKKSRKTKVKTVSFEESIAELSEIVRDLEGGQLSLDESLERYEQGVGHLKQCQKILADAERKIEILSGMDADGNPVTQCFDDEKLTLEEKAEQRSRRRSAGPRTEVSGKEPRASGSSSEQADVDENGTLF